MFRWTDYECIGINKIINMKNLIFGGLLAAFSFFSACVGDSKPKVGDAVFYDYEVRQGDSVIFKARRSMRDTPLIVVEKSDNREPIQWGLMENIVKLSVNDGMNFKLDNQKQGKLRLHRVIRAADFPKYIEEADKKEHIFQEKLQNIGRELRASLPFFQSRYKAVIDSTLTFTKAHQAGQLNDKLKTLPTGIQYYIVKGSDNVVLAEKKWAWFHYASIISKDKTVNSYNNLPKSTNLSEFAMIEQLERSAASFEEGAIVLLLIPTKLTEPQGGKMSEGNTVFWVEIVKVLPF